MLYSTFIEFGTTPQLVSTELLALVSNLIGRMKWVVSHNL